MSGSLVFRGVKKSFGEVQVLRGVDLEIPLDRFTYVVGQSGGGKSVLCRLAVGLLDPDEGEIHLDGRDVPRLSERAKVALRARCPYVVQGPALLDWLTLEENAALAAPRARPEEIRDALDKVGLAGLRDRYPEENGPGVNKRAAIARALLRRPRYLLLDEPLTGLDSGSAAEVNAVLQKLRREGLGALVVSHDYRDLEALADAVVVIGNGRVAFHGAPPEFLSSREPAVRALTAPAEVEAR